MSNIKLYGTLVPQTEDKVLAAARHILVTEGKMLDTVLSEKEQVFTAGTNITIDRTDPEHPVISASGSLPERFLKEITKTEAGVVTITDQDGNPTTFQTGGGSGGGVTQEYVDTKDTEVATQAHTEIVAVSEALDTVAQNLSTEETTRRDTDNEIKEDLITESNRAKAAEKALLVVPSTSKVEGAETARSFTVGGQSFNFPEGGSGDVTKEYVDTQDAAESARAQEAEQANATAISNETEARVAGEASLQAQLKSCATKDELENTAAELEREINDREVLTNKSSTMEQSDEKYPSCNAVINYIASLNGDNDTF